MTDRNGIEIDYCPQCRGVWLDRGELDKIIERGSGAPAEQARMPERERSERHDSDYGSGYPKHKRRESFLGEIFDF